MSTPLWKRLIDTHACHAAVETPPAPLWYCSDIACTASFLFPPLPTPFMIRGVRVVLLPA